MSARFEAILRCSALWQKSDEFATSDAKRIIDNSIKPDHIKTIMVNEVLRGLVKHGELVNPSRGKYKLATDSQISKSWRKLTNGQLSITHLANGEPV